VEFFDVVARRRSVRDYTDEVVPDDVIQKAFDAAILAPNSSNTQTWNFYWVKSPGPKKKLVEACLSQSAARKANHLIVVAADPSLWRRSQGPLIQWVQSVNAPKQVQLYYSKLIPHLYRWGILNSLAPIKWLAATVIGLFRPMARGPYTRRDAQEVAIKSAALAAENFVLAIAALGYDTCMMEGFDSSRVRRLLKMKCSERAVMVISVGRQGERATWGPQFRLPRDQVVKIV
jgi:nitroreductase